MGCCVCGFSEVLFVYTLLAIQVKCTKAPTRINIPGVVGGEISRGNDKYRNTIPNIYHTENVNDRKVRSLEQEENYTIC